MASPVLLPSQQLVREKCGSCCSELALTDSIILPPPKPKSRIHDVVERLLKQRSPSHTYLRTLSMSSLLSDITLVDPLSNADTSSTQHSASKADPTIHNGRPSTQHLKKWRDVGTRICVWFFYLGVLQAFNQWLNTLVGYGILHAARPHDAAFAVNIVAVMRTGALGGTATHLVIMAVFLLLESVRAWYDSRLNEAERDTRRARADEEYSRHRQALDESLRLRFQENMILVMFSFARAAASGAVGAALLWRASPLPMDTARAAATSVVGAMVLFVPRVAVCRICTSVVAREKVKAKARTDSTARAEFAV